MEATADAVDTAVHAAHTARGALAERPPRAALLRRAAGLIDAVGEEFPAATRRLGDAEGAGTDAAGRGIRLPAEVAPLAGRVVVDVRPTGVAVAPERHHGGRYPATTSTATSVGATALERRLRPVAYQVTPQAPLPPEPPDGHPPVPPCRIDGRAEGA